MKREWDALASHLMNDCRVLFGEPYSYFHSDKSISHATGIPTRTYSEVSGYSEPGVSGYALSLEIKLSDLKQKPEVRDEIHFRTQFYQVSEIREDDSGNAILDLKKRS